MLTTHFLSPGVLPDLTDGAGRVPAGPLHGVELPQLRHARLGVRHAQTRDELRKTFGKKGWGEEANVSRLVPADGQAVPGRTAVRDVRVETRGTGGVPHGGRHPPHGPDQRFLTFIPDRRRSQTGAALFQILGIIVESLLLFFFFSTSLFLNL